MYIKIEKDFFGDFLLIEGKKVELLNNKIPMTLLEYQDGLLKNLLEYDEVRARDLAPHFRYIFSHCNWGATPVTNMTVEDLKCGERVDANVTVRGITVDGVDYVTCGRIYILNDKGQTIQSC